MGDRSTVLVLTAPEDPTADAVITEIHRRGVPIARFDLGAFPLDIQLAATHDGHRWSGRLTDHDTSAELDEVCSVYYRRPSRFTFPPEMSTADRAYAEAEARLGLGGVLAALDCRWVSHPHHVARAEWKPLQLQTAAHCGLRTPPTLISNDPAAAVAFAEQVDGPVICKTLSSIVLADHGQHKITYTTLVDPATILDQPGHFMWLRPDPASPLLRAGDMRLVIHHDGDNDTRTTDLDLQVLAEPGLRALLGILEPALQPPSHSPGDARDTWFLFTTDNSWAEITTGDTTHTITEGGPRRIWPAVERAVAEWHRLGRPGRGRYGLTSSTNGTHDYWLDHPDQHILADTTTRSNG